MRYKYIGEVEMVDVNTLKFSKKCGRRPCKAVWNPNCAPIIVRRSDLLLIDGELRVVAAMSANVKQIRAQFVEE